MTHIAYLPLFGDVKAIKMIVFWSAISAALVCTQIGITERGTCARDKQLVSATMVAAIMVVHVVGVFFNIVVVVVHVCLILWVLRALVVRMLAVNAMQRHSLLSLPSLEGALQSWVLVAGAMSFEATMIAVTSRLAIVSRPAIAFATPPTAVVVLLAFQEPLELLPVTLFELVAKLMLGSRTKLLVVLPLYQAIAGTSKKNALKVLGESLQCLVAELAPVADVLRLIQVMERHIKPLNLKSSVGWRNISLGLELCDAEYLFKTMEMVQRICEELLVDAMDPTRRQVVILAIPGFFLVQSADQEQIDCTQEVLSQGTILCRLNNFWVDKLRKLLVEHLLPVGLVVAEEHIAELGKPCDVIQVQFF